MMQNKDISQLLAEARERKASPVQPVIKLKLAIPATHPKTLEAILSPLPSDSGYFIDAIDSHGRHKSIQLNTEQARAVNLAREGKSFIIIGAAGTGKTTCTKAVIAEVLKLGCPMLEDAHKHLTKGLPGIVPMAYTRRATNNLKRAMSEDIAKNTITIHKTLEYSPVYYEVMDDETGKVKNTMRFEPLRHIANTLDRNIRIIIIDEASMVSVDLYKEIEMALADKQQVMFIFIGDIQQLPPVFGHAILGYKLLELPVIELTEVYRQALDSPIISLAHRILSGNPLDEWEINKKWQITNQLQIIMWPKKLDNEIACMHAAKTLKQAYDAGKYDPEEDVILCPYNKSFGTIEINKHIANHIARSKGFITYEIIAGFQKYYYSIGDKVLYDKEDAIITDIESNQAYIGKAYQPASYTLDYWGHDREMKSAIMQNTDIDIDKLLEQAGQIEEGERTILASHRITLQILDTGDYVTVSTLSDMNKLAHAYCMTVHKAQGSEWQRVFLLLHWSHNPMLQRELLYTAVTRASKQLIIICEKDSFIRGIKSQVIKGNTLKDKAAFFKGKLPASKTS